MWYILSFHLCARILGVRAEYLSAELCMIDHIGTTTLIVYFKTDAEYLLQFQGI